MAKDPNLLIAIPIFVIRMYFSLEKVGCGLPTCVLECAVKKNVLMFSEDGNDVPGAGEHRRGDGIALSCLDCFAARTLMIQTQTAEACEVTKK